MADEVKRYSDQDLPFRKVRTKQELPQCEGDSLGKRAVKTVAGAVITGDASGAVVGIVTDSVINRLWPRKR